MRQILDKINQVLALLVVANLALMTFLVVLNVVLRYGFNSGITLTEELSRVLFVWMTFIGAILVLDKDEHVSMNVLLHKAPPFWQNLWLIALDILMLGLSGLLLLGCVRLSLQNMSNHMPITGIPTGVNYLAACVMALLFVVILISRIVARTLIVKRGEIA